MIKTEILIYNKEEHDITNKMEYRWFPFIVDETQIEGARLSGDDENDLDFGKTVIYMNSGHSMVINMYYEKFLELFTSIHES